MMGYFTMMMAICSVFTKLSDKPGIEDELAALWAELKSYDEKMYRKARHGVIGIGTNLPGKLGEKTTIGMYHLASKIFKFCLLYTSFLYVKFQMSILHCLTST